MAGAYRLWRQPARSATPRPCSPLECHSNSTGPEVPSISAGACSSYRSLAAAKLSRRSAIPTIRITRTPRPSPSVRTSPGRTSLARLPDLVAIDSDVPRAGELLGGTSRTGKASVPEPFVDALGSGFAHSRRFFSISTFSAASAANGLSGSTGRSRGRSARSPRGFASRRIGSGRPASASWRPRSWRRVWRLSSSARALA